MKIAALSSLLLLIASSGSAEPIPAGAIQVIDGDTINTRGPDRPCSPHSCGLRNNPVNNAGPDLHAATDSFIFGLSIGPGITG